jgi:hypothetical protein
MKVATALAVALVLAGCGGDSDDAAPTMTERAVAQVQGASGTYFVRGALLATGDATRLCSALLESYPPQCGEPSLVVEGLDLEGFEGLESTDDGSVSWADSVVLYGDVQDGTLTVRP